MDEKEKATERIRQEFKQEGGKGKSHILPSSAKIISNFVKAKIRDFKNEHKRVNLDTYLYRLSICRSCEYRNEDRCTHPDCGCYLSEKAWYDSEQCPLDVNRWIR